MMFNKYQMAQNVIVTSYFSWTSVVPCFTLIELTNFFIYFFRLDIRMHFGLLTSNDIQGLTEGNILISCFFISDNLCSLSELLVLHL